MYVHKWFCNSNVFVRLSTVVGSKLVSFAALVMVAILYSNNRPHLGYLGLRRQSPFTIPRLPDFSWYIADTKTVINRPNTRVKSYSGSDFFCFHSNDMFNIIIDVMITIFSYFPHFSAAK
jgi:hypothetical protein